MEEGENGREKAKRREVLREKLQELRRLEADMSLLDSTEPPSEVIKSYQPHSILQQIVENQASDPLLRPKTNSSKGCTCQLA
jgi:hypothetical protein